MSMKRTLTTIVSLLLLLMLVAACQAAPATAPEPVAEVTEPTEAAPSPEPEEPAEPAPDPTEPPATAEPATPVPSPEPTAAAATPEATEEVVDLAGSELVIYSGRNEELVGPLIEMFSEATGIEAAVRYGNTAEMAATILEEGRNSPADIFFGQDAGALGALAQEGRLQALPQGTLDLVDPRFRAPDGEWVGVSGRARVVAYNTNNLTEDDLPDSIFDFTDPQWRGRIGWAPTNGSFQSFVTALRVTEGEDAAREWLEGIQANEPQVYANNNAILEGVASGEVDVGFVNHYYLFRQLEEQGEGYAARNYFFPGGDLGSLINVAGAGIVDTAGNQEAAQAFIDYLLSAEAQEYFRNQTKEYPLVTGIDADPMLPPLEGLDTPDIDLNQLYDLEGTLEMLQEAGVL
jgi:iron(III) transport system substrate-binding protein